jgi:cytochrome c oxidase subunit 3
VPLGTLNTAVLLGSSLTMALAVRAARLGERRKVVGLLVATMALGVVFLTIKGLEYSLEYDEGLIPGTGFDYPGAHAEQAKLFFRFYFLMTGLHALHLAIGILVAGGMAILARQRRFDPPHDTPVDLLGLYWHFVDIVWVFLLPALYLIH